MLCLLANNVVSNQLLTLKMHVLGNIVLFPHIECYSWFSAFWYPRSLKILITDISRSSVSPHRVLCMHFGMFVLNIVEKKNTQNTCFWWLYCFFFKMSFFCKRFSVLVREQLRNTKKKKKFVNAVFFPHLCAFNIF